MGMYRKEWDCCGSVTETDAWEPEVCPFCSPSQTDRPQPTPPDDERAAFETWMREDCNATDDDLKRPYGVGYFWANTGIAWEAWQARAALRHPPVPNVGEAREVADKLRWDAVTPPLPEEFSVRDVDAAKLYAKAYMAHAMKHGGAPTQADAEPVGVIVADDPVQGWHMHALIPWDKIGPGTKLYTSAEPAAADTGDVYRQLTASIAAWWEEHRYDTTGERDEWNVYNEVPEFVQLARNLSSASSASPAAAATIDTATLDGLQHAATALADAQQHIASSRDACWEHERGQWDHYQKGIDAIADLRARLASAGAGEDTARLDWLEQSRRTFCGNYSGSDFRVIGSSVWHGTLRDAIDAARQDSAAADKGE